MIIENNLPGPKSWSIQPDPIKNDNTAVWDLVLKDMEGAKFNHPTQEKIHHILIEHIKLRDKTGEQKYHVRLQPFNGREALQDAYEEFLDAIVYLRQALYEFMTTTVIETPESEFFRVGISSLYAMSLDAALRLCFMIEKKKENDQNVKSISNTGNGGSIKEFRNNQPNLIIS